MCAGLIPGSAELQQNRPGLRIKVFEGGEIIQFLSKSWTLYTCMNAIVVHLRTLRSAHCYRIAACYGE